MVVKLIRIIRVLFQKNNNYKSRPVVISSDTIIVIFMRRDMDNISLAFKNKKATYSTY